MMRRRRKPKYMDYTCGIAVWDLRTRTLLHTLTGHTSTVRALCFTPKGDKLCSSGGDFTLCVWAL